MTQAISSTFVDLEMGAFAKEDFEHRTCTTPSVAHGDETSTLLADRQPSAHESDLLNLGQSVISTPGTGSSTPQGGLLDLDDLLGGFAPASVSHEVRFGFFFLLDRLFSVSKIAIAIRSV